MAAKRDRQLSIEEAADLMGVPVSTLRYWRYRGKGEGPQGAKFGARIRYRESEVLAWVDARYTAAS